MKPREAQVGLWVWVTGNALRGGGRKRRQPAKIVEVQRKGAMVMPQKHDGAEFVRFRDMKLWRSRNKVTT